MDIQSKTIFISYATQEDPTFVNRLRKDLQSHGIKVWLDKYDIRSRGKTFLHEIQDAIINADRLILVVGPHSMESEYVQYEWQFANEHCIIINPVIRSGAIDLLPQELSKLHIYDFRDDENYGPTIDSLINEINCPIEPLGDLIGFKSLPNPFINRSDAIQCVRNYIASDLLNSSVTMSYENISAIYGMGGLGKSVVANAFGRDCFIRRSFSNGVFWLPCGERPDHEANLIRILSYFNEAPTIHESLDNLILRVSKIFQDKRILLILDDIHNSGGILPYLDIIKGRSRLLLTTREEGLSKRIAGDRAYSLQLLSHNDAIDLLYKKSLIPVNTSLKDYDEIVELCGYLPLAIALCGGMIRESMPSKDLIDALKESDLEFIDTELFGYEYSNVYKAFMISLKSLRNDCPEVSDLYLSLAVFQKGEPIPEKALFTYWNNTGNLKERDIKKYVSTIQSKALCNIIVDGAERFLEIHDLLHGFILKQCENVIYLHKKLINCYKSKCSGRWASLPEDNYIYYHLTDHLCKADKLHDIMDLLSEEDNRNKNSWWTLKYGIDPSAKSYVEDIFLARKAFIAKNKTAAESGSLPCPYLGQEIFTYVVQASLNSMFSKLSGELTIDLITSGYWDTDDALSVAALIPGNMNRINSYEKIAPLLNNDQLNQAIEESKKTKDTDGRSELLSVLVPWLSFSGGIKRAIETALDIEVDRYRNKAIKKIASILYTQKRMTEAYETITYLPRNNEYIDGLKIIVNELPDYLLNLALRDILEIPFEEKQSSSGGSFKVFYDPKSMSDDQVKHAVLMSLDNKELDNNGIYKDPSGVSVRYVQPRTLGIHEIIEYLARKGLIDEAIEAVNTIKNDDDRFEGYLMLAPYVSDDEKNFMIENILSGETIVKPFFIKLLPYLIERKEYELVNKILFKVDDILEKIKCIKKIIELADDEYISSYTIMAVNIIKSNDNFIYWRRMVEAIGESLSERDQNDIINDIINRIQKSQIEKNYLNKAFGYIAESCSKIKYYSGLLRVLQLISDESQKSDQLDRYLSELKTQYLNDTVFFIQNNIEPKKHDDFFNKLFDQLIQDNQISEAEQILSLIENKEGRDKRINALNKKVHDLNLEETLRQVQTIDDRRDVNYFLIDTIKFMLLKGFFDNSYNSAKSIHDIKTRLDAFEEIIPFAEHHYLKDLCNKISDIDFEINSDDFYSKCANRYAELDNFNEMRICLNKIENIEEREFSAKRVSDALARSGRFIEAEMVLSEIEDPEKKLFGLLVLHSNLASKSTDYNRIKQKIFHVLNDNNIDGKAEIADFLDYSGGPNEKIDAWAEKLYEQAKENPCSPGPYIHPNLSGIDILPLNIRKKYLKCILDAKPRINPDYIEEIVNCHKGFEFIVTRLDQSIIRDLFHYQKNRIIDNMHDNMRYWRARTMCVLFDSMQQTSKIDNLTAVTMAATEIENKLLYLLANIPLIELVSESQKEKIINKSTELLDSLIVSDELEDNRLLGYQIFFPVICHLDNLRFYKKWRSLIEHAVRGERNSLLRFLRTAYPIIFKLGGIEAIENTFQSANRASTWWP